MYIIGRRNKPDTVGNNHIILGTPPMQHQTYESAVKEAARLAGQMPAFQFIIFNATHTVETTQPPVDVRPFPQSMKVG